MNVSRIINSLIRNERLLTREYIDEWWYSSFNNHLLVFFKYDDRVVSKDLNELELSVKELSADYSAKYLIIEEFLEGVINELIGVDNNE